MPVSFLWGLLLAHVVLQPPLAVAGTWLTLRGGASSPDERLLGSLSVLLCCASSRSC